MLRWRSQEGNVKLRALAEQVLADVRTLKHDKGAPLSRQTFDELFLTAHDAWRQEHLNVKLRALADELMTVHEGTQDRSPT